MSTHQKKQRTCPIAGCTVQIANKLLMCPDHWRLCPKHLRSEVWRYYRAGQEKTGGASPVYFEAARNAIQHVEKEERIASAGPNMKSFYIRYRNLPMKFLEMAGREVANGVATNMATTFPTRDAALDRAHQQWGDNGLEHIEVCTFGVPHPKDKKVSREESRSADAKGAKVEQGDLI